MVPTETLTPQEQFFFEHSGWGYRPGVETPDVGRTRGAKEAAAAETFGKANGYTARWEEDWQLDHVAEPSSCEECLLLGPDGVVGSLGCIDDATPEYRRVVEAELMREQMFALAQQAARDARADLVPE